MHLDFLGLVCEKYAYDKFTIINNIQVIMDYYIHIIKVFTYYLTCCYYVITLWFIYSTL